MLHRKNEEVFDSEQNIVCKRLTLSFLLVLVGAPRRRWTSQAELQTGQVDYNGKDVPKPATQPTVLGKGDGMLGTRRRKGRYETKKE